MISLMEEVVAGLVPSQSREKRLTETKAERICPMGQPTVQSGSIEGTYNASYR
jgi:hypothetical protein